MELPPEASCSAVFADGLARGVIIGAAWGATVSPVDRLLDERDARVAGIKVPELRWSARLSRAAAATGGNALTFGVFCG